MNNNEIFEQFWKSFDWPQPKAISYRLYYDDQGFPLSYTMEDLPGKYIEITAQQFQESSPHVRVKDQQLIKLTHSAIRKLTPAIDGTCCHPDNVAVIVPESESNTKWKINHYDNS